MWKFLNILSLREVLLFGLTVSAVFSFLAIKYFFLPVYDKKAALRAQVQLMSAEYTKLRTNLTVSEKMGRDYDILRDEAVLQTESDPITLSAFLQQIEVAARRPTLVLINMKPQTIVTGESFKCYPVKLSVSGSLREIVGFVSDLLSTENVIGIENFTLRGLPGYGRVECSMEPYMIKIIPLPVREREKQDG